MLLMIAWLTPYLGVGETSQPTPKASLPASIRRIVFLGDSITYAGQYITDIEAYFITRYPERSMEFINVGLPSETVSGLTEEGHAGGKFPRPDLHERLARVLEQTKPELVLACYGMNDGIYMPWSRDRFQKYQEGMKWLHQQVTLSNARIIMVTPPTFDSVKGGSPGYNEVLGHYSDWLVSQRAIGWEVVDLHKAMDQFLTEQRKLDPAFALAGDGVHPGDLGHWLMAKQILLYLGGMDIAGVDSAAQMIGTWANGKEILKLIGERQAIMKDAWLTATRHTRPEMNKGLPLEEAKAKARAMGGRIHEILKSP